MTEHEKHRQCPPASECTQCAELDCPHNNPRHYHPDGCPSCSAPSEQRRPYAPPTIEQSSPFPAVFETIEKLTRALGEAAVYIADMDAANERIANRCKVLEQRCDDAARVLRGEPRAEPPEDVRALLDAFARAADQRRVVTRSAGGLGVLLPSEIWDEVADAVEALRGRG